MNKVGLREINILNEEDILVNEYYVPIIDKIIERRIQLKLSKSELAIRSSVPRMTIHRIENLECIPNMGTLCKILKTLNLNIDVIDK